MAFKLKDRVRRIGQHEDCTVEDIREPDEHILRLNAACGNYVLDTTWQRF